MARRLARRGSRQILAVFVALGVVGLSACSRSTPQPGSSTLGPPPGASGAADGAEVRLATGTEGAQRWELFARAAGGQLCVRFGVRTLSGGYCTPEPAFNELSVNEGASTGSISYLLGGAGANVAAVRVEWRDGTAQSAPAQGAAGFAYRAFVLFLPGGGYISAAERAKRVVALDSSGREVGALDHIPGCSTGCRPR